MFVDVEFEVRPDVGVILAIIGDGSPEATRLDVGLYQVRHFSFEHVAKAKLEPYWQEMRTFDDVESGVTLLPSEYGVCDSPDQFVGKFGGVLKSSSRKFCVSFTKICRDDQPESGGWRWHKWGPYVGEHEPTVEYLRDEPQIEVVFAYHVYEVVS